MVAVPSIGRASLVEADPVAPEAIATHALYERHAAKILSYCRHQLGSREEAEDAVQTTFMNAFRALGKGVVPEAEAAWLYKIAENVCLSRRRSSWRRNRIESPADFELIEEIVPGPNRQCDELIGIEDALAAMPEQQRRAILLREWQGLSYREISTELELTQSAVETLIFRARRSLAQGLTEPAKLKPQPQPRSERRRLRRALHLVDLTSLLAGAKSLLAGTAALKATAAAVVVTAAAGTAVTVGPSFLDAPRKPPLPVPAGEPVQPPAATPTARASSNPVAAPSADSERRIAPGKAKPVPAATKAKGKGKAGAAERRQSPRATPVLPATAKPDRGAPSDRATDRVERKADRTQQRAARAEQRAASAQRQAHRRQLQTAEARPVRAEPTKKPAKPRRQVAAAAVVPGAELARTKAAQSKAKERALLADEASGAQPAQQLADKQSKRP